MKWGKTRPNCTAKQLIPEFLLSILLTDSNKVCLQALNTSTNTVKHSSLQKLGSSPQFHFHNKKEQYKLGGTALEMSMASYNWYLRMPYLKNKLQY